MDFAALCVLPSEDFKANGAVEAQLISLITVLDGISSQLQAPIALGQIPFTGSLGGP